MSSANGNAKADAVTAESYGAIDSSHVSDEVWMVRIPPKLAEVWNEASEGTVLGELVFTKGGKASGAAVKPSLAVHVSEDILASEQSDLPLEYTMEAMTKRVPVLHPFTRKPDGSIAIRGTVTRTANLQVSRSDERYRQLCKNRILQTSVTSSRFVKPVEANELSVRKSHSAALKSAKGFGNAVQQFGARMMEANEGGGDASKKRKFEGQPTRSIIFELFSGQPYLSVKEMRQASGRLEKEIKQVLSEIGEFHRSGEHKGLWQLRKEFQKQDGS